MKENLCWSSFSQLKQLQLRANLHNPFIVQDLQPVKTYFVFGVHTMSATATFPQLHTKTQPSVVRAAVEKENLFASFTWEHCEILMWYWWKAPPRWVIDFLSLLWRISESLVFVQRFIRNRDENLFSGDCCRDQRYLRSFLSNRDAATWWGCVGVFPGLAKTAWNDQTLLQTLTWVCCPVVQTLKSEWEERVLALYLLSSQGWMTAKFSLTGASFILVQKEYNSQESFKQCSARHFTKVASPNTQWLFLLLNSFLCSSFPLLSALPFFSF